MFLSLWNIFIFYLLGYFFKKFHFYDSSTKREFPTKFHRFLIPQFHTFGSTEKWFHVEVPVPQKSQTLAEICLQNYKR